MGIIAWILIFALAAQFFQAAPWLLLVFGGLIAFLMIIGRTFAAKKFGHYEATGAIVVSYYWHFVDVVWIGLFLIIYVLK
jgi:cytochrome c oxidase subunit 3